MSNKNKKIIDNMTKYNTYKNLYDKLQLAIENEFYFEGCLISCSIIEDRIVSIFKYMNEEPSRWAIVDRIKQIKAIGRSRDKDIEEIFDDRFIAVLYSWIDDRNKIVHGIANSEYDIKRYKKVAIRGMELSKEMVNRVNKYKLIQVSRIKSDYHNKYDLYKDKEKNYYYCEKGLEVSKDNLIRVEGEKDKYFDKRKARLLSNISEVL